MIPACRFDWTPIPIREEQSDFTSSSRNPPDFCQRDWTVPCNDGTEMRDISRLAGDHEFVIIAVTQEEVLRISVKPQTSLAEIFTNRDFLFE